MKTPTTCGDTNKRQRIPKGQSKKDNAQKLTTYGTQDEKETALTSIIQSGDPLKDNRSRVTIHLQSRAKSIRGKWRTS